MSTEMLTFPCPRRCPQRSTLIRNLPRSESGAPGPESGPRGSNSTIFAKVFSAIQISEMPPEIPSESHLENLSEYYPKIHIEIYFDIFPQLNIEIYPSNDIYGRSIGVCATHR